LILGLAASSIFYALGYGSYGETAVFFTVGLFTLCAIPMLKKQFYGAALFAWGLFELLFRLFNPYWSFNPLTGREPKPKEILTLLQSKSPFEARKRVYIRTFFYYADSYSYEEILADAEDETRKKAGEFLRRPQFRPVILKQNRNLNSELIEIETFAALDSR